LCRRHKWLPLRRSDDSCLFATAEWKPAFVKAVEVMWLDVVVGKGFLKEVKVVVHSGRSDSLCSDSIKTDTPFSRYTVAILDHKMAGPVFTKAFEIWLASRNLFIGILLQRGQSERESSVGHFNSKVDEFRCLGFG